MVAFPPSGLIDSGTLLDARRPLFGQPLFHARQVRAKTAPKLLPDLTVCSA